MCKLLTTISWCLIRQFPWAVLMSCFKAKLPKSEIGLCTAGAWSRVWRKERQMRNYARSLSRIRTSVNCWKCRTLSWNSPTSDAWSLCEEATFTTGVTEFYEAGFTSLPSSKCPPCCDSSWLDYFFNTQDEIQLIKVDESILETQKMSETIRTQTQVSWWMKRRTKTNQDCA